MNGWKLFDVEFADLVQQGFVADVEHGCCLFPVPLGLLQGSENDFFSAVEVRFRLMFLRLIPQLRQWNFDLGRVEYDLV
jgi:hypothetical protein